MRIAFAGRSGSGKTTMVNQLITRYGGIELNFADPLKQIMTFTQDICNIPREKDRKLLQLLGTEWGRNKDELMWVRLLEQKLESTEGNIFIGDLRFPNEKEMLKKHGFMCIYISTGQETSHEEHISERAFYIDEEWDLIIKRSDLPGMFESLCCCL